MQEVFFVIDSFGRKIEYMRVSVTDRCNLRCGYCMPDGVKSIPMEEILTFEEIAEVCRAAASLGVKYIRLTGGEPLVRPEIEKLVRMIKSIEGIEKLTMTTNGLLLKDKLAELIRAGLDGVNISLDTLDREKYRRLTGFDRLGGALEALDSACASGIKVKINTVVLNENIDECADIAGLSKDRPIDVRFIEIMPIGEGKKYSSISCEQVFTRIKELYPGIRPEISDEIGGPAVYYRIDGFRGRTGFINAVHSMFCDGCNRIRLTSEGFLKTCLCYDSGAQLKGIIRSGGDIRPIMERAVYEKPEKHCFDSSMGVTEKRGMSGIGG